MRMEQYNPENMKHKNLLLMKSYLDKEGTIHEVSVDSTDTLAFFKVKGLANFWDSKENLNFDMIMGDLVSSLATVHTTLVYILYGNSEEINVYVGVTKDSKNILESSLDASFPYIEHEEIAHYDINQILNNCSQYGGIITGNPTNKTYGEQKQIQIERLCNGLLTGSQWVYVMIGKCSSPALMNLTYNKLLDELDDVSKYIKRTINGGSLGNETWESVNYHNQQYFEYLEHLERRLNQGRIRGMWRTHGYYASSDYYTAEKLHNLIPSIYSGEDSKPEKVRTLRLENSNNIIPHLYLLNDELPESIGSIHPLGEWLYNGRTIKSFNYRYQSMLTSDELSTFTQMPRKEMPGFYINPYVEFEVSERRNGGNFQIGNIMNGNKQLSNLYNMDLGDLNRHGLIVGITGGGKSNTSKSLIKNLWNKHRKPFMVIESAKREYWELANIEGFKEDISIFTLGSEEESGVPYRINPFERIEGVPLQTHIDYVLSTFKASFDLFPPLPHVLERSIYGIYEDKGWDILKGTNIFGTNQYPTLDDLYYKIDNILDDMGYDVKVKSDIAAALKGRVDSLRIGGKGAMLNTEKSVPIGELLSKPVVMELEDIGDDDVKSFIMGLLLVQIYEYRKSNIQRNKGFEHLILIEEAHRLLANVQGGGEANPRAKAVEFFTNLLAEIRSYGQGFLIADQVPSKLAQDVLKNTNLKIVHRTVMQEDRELIGQSMNMSNEQIQYLSALKRGEAAVYSEGDMRPKLLKMPYVKEDYNLSRQEVVNLVKQKLVKKLGTYEQSYNYGPSCAFCTEKCLHKQTVDQFDDLIINNEWKDQLQNHFASVKYNPNWLVDMFKIIEQKGYDVPSTGHAKLCAANIFLIDSELKVSYRREIVKEYKRILFEREYF